MKLELYTARLSRGFLVEWLLEELALPYERVEIDVFGGEQKSARYRAIHPLGVVPALVVDGQPLLESLAICLFLADAHPSAGLAPSPSAPARAAYLQWMVYATATIEPKIGPAFVRSLGVPEHERAGVSTADERAAFAEVLAPLAPALARGHALTSGFSAADVLIGGELYWAQQVGLCAALPDASRYLATVTSRPAFQRAVDAASRARTA